MRKPYQWGKVFRIDVWMPDIYLSTTNVLPAKNLLPFLPTAPLQYVPKIRFTQARTTNKAKNAPHKETVILNYIGGDPISYSLSN